MFWRRPTSLSSNIAFLKMSNPRLPPAVVFFILLMGNLLFVILLSGYIGTVSVPFLIFLSMRLFIEWMLI